MAPAVPTGMKARRAHHAMRCRQGGRWRAGAVGREKFENDLEGSINELYGVTRTPLFNLVAADFPHSRPIDARFPGPISSRPMLTTTQTHHQNRQALWGPREACARRVDGRIFLSEAPPEKVRGFFIA